ncbi:antibiotic biosynthesis monooxygenase [Brevibacterium sp. 5221]|uniref:Antibiotic biosynthesis monooxygenase n=1 Tax=Brevibacterium rongguiense TaxID=2695267 RepID=A0A6N9H6A5_9MICO|nr:MULTISPECIES: antibiotic biosynthesis monooxygenase [Brevibacterium]MYM19134.1 antibiotic biosynthesis monooxygenase [Brevibacterium rongguiense]WAL40622.1 antibiotic biosynthesis monooxygenase [Brevibacterium sp. BRM-1]
MSLVKINVLSVPEGDRSELEARFAARKHSVDSEPGFEGFELLRPVRGEDRYYVLTRWADEESFEAWRDKRTPRAPGTAVSQSDGMLEFEVVDLPD